MDLLSVLIYFCSVPIYTGGGIILILAALIATGFLAIAFLGVILLGVLILNGIVLTARKMISNSN